MIRINLLSDREAIRKETSRQQISIYLLMILLLVVTLIAIQYVQHQKQASLKIKVDEVQQEVNKNKLKVGEVEKFKKDKQELEEKLGIINKLQKGKQLITKLMADIEGVLPDKMWFDSIDFKGSSLAFDGCAIDDETIAKFMKDLERSRSFTSVNLNMTEQKTIEGIGIRHFTLTTQFAPPEEDKSDKGDSKDTQDQPGT